MISVLVGGEFLDLSPESKITIRRRHNLFDGSDPTIKRGSYTLPFTIPLTDHNRRLLSNPHRIDNRNGLLIDEPAYLYISDSSNVGIPYLGGKLYISKADEYSAECSIVTAAVEGFDDTSLRDLDLGSVTKASPTDMRNHAQTTNAFPLSHPECFIPVYNSSFFNQEIRNNVDHYDPHASGFALWTQNYYSRATSVFGTDGRLQIVTPFLRIGWLLEQVFAHFNLHLYNEIEEEYSDLKLIYLYHNRNLFADGEWPEEINYTDCVVDMKCGDFFKQYAAMLFLGTFVDPVRRVVELRTWKTVLSANEAYDWSAKDRTDYTIDGQINKPDYIGYDADTYQEIVDTYPVKDGYLQGNDAFYNRINDRYYGVRTASGGRGSRSVIDRLTRILIGGVGDPITFKMKPLRTYLRTDFRNTHPQNATLWDNGLIMPSIVQSGTYQRYLYDDSNNPIDEDGNTVTEFSDGHQFELEDSEIKYAHVMLYRGRLTGNEPYANNTDFNPEDIDAPYTHSLLLDGDSGLVNQLGTEAVHFLKTHKRVTKSIDLSISDLLGLKEYHKVRIDNMVYLVSEIEVTFDTTGIAGPAKVVLCTVQ